jgi:hypothetical protein
MLEAAVRGVHAELDAVLAKHADRLWPDTETSISFWLEPEKLLAVADLASAMRRRADFDGHVAEQLALPRGWARTDPGERYKVDKLAHQLGLGAMLDATLGTGSPDPAAPQRALVFEEPHVAKFIARLRSHNPDLHRAYLEVLGKLSRGEAGKNQHPLQREYQGMFAADLAGSGAGRGKWRVVYAIDDGQIIIKDVVDYHTKS